jgi:5,10-methylenetetrahydromethanopterin reductase
MAEMARAAELSGIVESVWVAEGHLARDSLVSLSAIAGSTESVQLATGVINPFTRHPAQLAASFATLDELAGGRVACGVGIGTRNSLAELGFDVSRPVVVAQEMVELLRGLVARRTITLEGERFQVESARLGFRPLRPEMPIYIGTVGPRLCELASQIADGIYLTYGTEAFLHRVIGYLDTSAMPPDFDVACQILMAVDDDPEVARRMVAPGIGLNLIEPNAEHVLEANGIDPAKARSIRDALASGGIRAMAGAVDREIIDRLTIAGQPDECEERLLEAAGAGLTHITVSILGGDPAPTLEVLAAVRRRWSDGLT